MFSSLLTKQIFDHSLYQSSHPPKRGSLWENLEESLVLSVTSIIYHVQQCVKCGDLPVLLTSQSDTPSSRPHIQSSTLQVPAEDCMALPDPWGGLVPLAFVFFSITASTIAQQASCTVLTVTYNCTVLPAQLTGPVKLSPMSLALV